MLEQFKMAKKRETILYLSKNLDLEQFETKT